MTHKPSESIKKSNMIVSILKFIGKGFLAILLILSIVFQLPWKVITLLAVILAACTILPVRFRKWFWLTAGSATLAVIIWIFLPEDNTGWRPYAFDKEIAAFEAKYKIPDDENAAFDYYDIFNSLVMDSNMGAFSLDPNLSSLDKPWSAENYPKMAAWLNGYKETIQKLILTSKIEKCILPPVPYADRFDFSDSLPKLRYCAFLLISSANNDIAEGRIDEAVEKYTSAFRMADQLHQFPSMTHVSVHWAIKEKTLRPLNRYLIEGHPDSEQLNKILKILNRPQNRWSSDWPAMLDPTKLSIKDKIAGITFETDDTGKLRYSRRPFFKNEGSEKNAGDSTYFSGVKGKIRATVRWAFFPPSPKAIDKIVDKGLEQPYAMANSDFKWDDTGSANTFLKLNYKYVIQSQIRFEEYNYRQLHNIYLKHITLLRGSQLLVAIRQYKDEHGKWPESLKEIKSDVPAEAFVDPATGEALQYESDGKQFMLSGKLVNIWPYENKNTMSFVQTLL